MSDPRLARLLDFAKGRRRHMTRREIVERDFAEFLAWLKERGFSDGVYTFEKATWDFIMFQRLHHQFTEDRQRRAQLQQRDQAILDAVRIGSQGIKSTLIAAIMAWPKEDRESLLAVLSGPPSDTPPERIDERGERIGEEKDEADQAPMRGEEG